MSAKQRINVALAGSLRDMPESREALIRLLHGLQFTPLVAEDLPAAATNLLTAVFDLVDRADAWICLIGSHYGYRPDDPDRNPGGLSITELEYRRAQERGIPILIFMSSDEARPAHRAHDRFAQSTEEHDKLRRFKEHLFAHHPVNQFSSPDELVAEASSSLVRLRQSFEPSKFYFASHARVDAERVRAFVSGLKRSGVKVWIDIDELAPGENWQVSLQSHLVTASGLLIFVSHASMQSRFVRAELEAMAGDHPRLIVPVILEHVPDLPASLRARQWIDLTNAHSIADIAAAAEANAWQLAAALERAPSESRASFEQSIYDAAELASELQSKPDQAPTRDAPPRSVFLIHGHEEAFLTEIEGFIRSLNIEPVVLKRIGGPAQSLWQKFNSWSRETRYAIALLSPDDLGAATREYDAEYEGRKVGPTALQYRARQNVILELGYFYGYLDWDKVFVLFKPAANAYPRFEMPSDLAGIVYDSIDDSGQWKQSLRDSLAKAGFELPLDTVGG